MKTRVELIYDRDCPNIKEARAVLLKAFAGATIPPRWTEWERNAPGTPEYSREYGSPTVLVNGRDVAGAPAGVVSDCCRIYSDEQGGIRRAPSVPQIAAALIEARRSRLHPKSVAWTLPSVAFLAPVGVCPACWPLYTSLLASAGLSFLTDATYLLPIALALVVTALAPLLSRARRSGRHGPLALGIAAASLALVGKFLAASPALLWGGLALLFGASIWSWRQISPMAGSCAKCAPYLPADSVSEHSVKEDPI